VEPPADRFTWVQWDDVDADDLRCAYTDELEAIDAEMDQRHVAERAVIEAARALDLFGYGTTEHVRAHQELLRRVRALDALEEK